MPRTRQYRKHAEFNGINELVIEYLTQKNGMSISELVESGSRHTEGSQDNEPDRDKQIWYNKAGLDKFVARSLNVKMEDYGKADHRNPFYRAIVDSITDLRQNGVLIDWKTIKSNTGIGIWRIDPNKIDAYARNQAEIEMLNRNYWSKCLETTLLVRQKQEIFRQRLLNMYAKCLFCGFIDQRYMVGAHIVPYSVMREEEPQNSMNPGNGLRLCKLCDTAFEKGHIMVENNFGIEVKPFLTNNDDPAVKSWINFIPDKLRIEHGAKYKPDSKYLEWKRELLTI